MSRARVLLAALGVLGTLGAGAAGARAQDPPDDARAAEAPRADDDASASAGARSADDEGDAAPPVAPLPDDATIAAARGEATLFLLRTQNDDGTWSGPVSSPVARHRAWTLAATALCVEALLRPVSEAPRDSRARDAWTRGVRALLPLCAEAQPTSHAIWGDAYALSALCAVLGAGPQRDVETSAVRSAAQGLVTRLARARGADGAWGVGDERDAARPDGAPRGPFAYRTGQTHVTAVVVLALQAALDVGLEGTEPSLVTGREALRRSRLPSGTFTHRVALLPGPGHRDGVDEFPAALARTPAAVLALLDAVPYGTTRRDVLAALDAFYRHHAALDVVLERSESVVSGQSAYVYLFGHHYAARALDVLPAAERALFARRLARDVLVVRRSGGAIFDHPLLGFGPAVGTAFALLALQHVQDA